MHIELSNIKPSYMSEIEIANSDIYLQSSLIFERGKKYQIKANSGHGKSSLLNFIYGSNINFSGAINYNLEIRNFLEMRKDKLSYVFQDHKLFPSLTALENVVIKNTLTGHKSINEIDNLLEEFSLSHKRDTPVKNLSLGQRQRVAIIRSLCQPFDFLLLDEPFSHLDSANIMVISKVIDAELNIQGAGMLMTTLEENQVFEFDETLNL